jgi:hypothetical protein
METDTGKILKSGSFSPSLSKFFKLSIFAGSLFKTTF